MWEISMESSSLFFFFLWYLALKQFFSFESTSSMPLNTFSIISLMQSQLSWSNRLFSCYRFLLLLLLAIWSSFPLYPWHFSRDSVISECLLMLCLNFRAPASCRCSMPASSPSLWQKQENRSSVSSISGVGFQSFSQSLLSSSAICLAESLRSLQLAEMRVKPSISVFITASTLLIMSLYSWVAFMIISLSLSLLPSYTFGPLRLYFISRVLSRTDSRSSPWKAASRWATISNRVRRVCVRHSRAPRDISASLRCVLYLALTTLCRQLTMSLSNCCVFLCTTSRRELASLSAVSFVLRSPCSCCTLGLVNFWSKKRAGFRTDFFTSAQVEERALSLLLSVSQACWNLPWASAYLPMRQMSSSVGLRMGSSSDSSSCSQNSILKSATSSMARTKSMRCCLKCLTDSSWSLGAILMRSERCLAAASKSEQQLLMRRQQRVQHSCLFCAKSRVALQAGMLRNSERMPDYSTAAISWFIV